jgi:hypothetical protein
MKRLLVLVAIIAAGCSAGAPKPTPAPTEAPRITMFPLDTVAPVVTPEPVPAVPTKAPAPRTYATLTARSWALLVKAPDEYKEQGYQIWTCISQFDAATGTDTFRGDASYRNETYWYNGANALFVGTTEQLRDFVQGDLVLMNVMVLGSFTYDTQSGGTATVPSFAVMTITLKGSCA